LRTSEGRTKNDRQQKKASFDHISTSSSPHRWKLHRVPSGAEKDDSFVLAVAGYGNPVAAILFP